MTPAFSLEFFPPKTPEGVAKLAATRAELIQLKPEFISVTFGAGGSTREGTLSTVQACRGLRIYPASVRPGKEYVPSWMSTALIIFGV
jgi:5,10-methylenetetrahydrofolate reductase